VIEEGRIRAAGSWRKPAAVLALVLLCAILFGALIAGSPVNGDDSHAARTAGINLTTPPTARTATAAALGALLVTPLLAAFVVVPAVTAAMGTVRRGRRRDDLRPASFELARSAVRRGPPAHA